MAFDSNGNPNVYVKHADGKVVIGTAGSDRLTVDNGGQVTLTNDLNTTAGGQHRSVTYFRPNVLQGTAPFMTSSQVSGSSVGTGRFNFTAVPMRQAGSVIGVTVWAGVNGGTVKSGTLTATVCIGTAGTTVTSVTASLSTGSVASATVLKDAVTFAANDLLCVQLTASSTYLSEPDITSASIMAIVDYEL